MALTPKQEKFCLVYHQTSNGAESYRQAYNASKMTLNSICCEASKLLDDPNITQRLKELRDGAAKRHAVTVDSIAQELEEARNVALQEGQASAAVSASMGKAKLYGLITDKSKVEGNVTVIVSTGINIEDDVTDN